MTPPRIEITINQAGQLVVNTNTNHVLTMVGLLEMAKASILAQQQKSREGQGPPIIIAQGSLPHPHGRSI